MRIVNVSQRSYRYRSARKIGDANWPLGFDDMTGGFTFIETDEGITGVAPLGGSAVPSLAPLLIGLDPRGVVGLWQSMIAAVFKGGNEGEWKAAISALDIALWDLKAKINLEPLWKTLGALDGRCKAYASGIDMCLTDAELRAFYRRMAGRGVDAGKLKVGLDMDADLRRLAIVQEELSLVQPRPSLMIDSNEYWSPKQAIRAIRQFEERFDLTWVEEPARRWDYRGLRKVSQSVRAAVATGENLNDASDFSPLILNEAVDVVEIGMGTTGITGALQVAHMAAGFELPVAMMNCPGNVMAHVAAALPNHMMMEVVEAGREVCWHADNHIENGFIVLGDSPGLGITIDEEKLAALERETQEHPRSPSPPRSRRRGAGLYAVPVTEEERQLGPR
ncbi:MAG: mandelate racemase/muconate lactonizing enzyme family protein [Chloroflexi bacterium]|nr:mandelate racemase/muconate lactonizing enzyme family protein [Chloroflexota bacterium]